MMKKLFMGIDLSLNGTGLSVVDESGGLIQTVLIELNTKKANCLRGKERTKHIIKTILDLISKHNPAKIGIEGYSFGSKGRSFIDLAELGGTVRYLMTERNIIWVEVPPKTLKKLVTDNGNADKELMMKTVREKYNLTFTDDNECDAYCLARTVATLSDEELLEKCGERTKKKIKKAKATPI